MNELDYAIMKFFNMFSFGTPKELIDTIYPDFEKHYPDKNSFRIIIHRRLKRLPLKKLPLPGFYCHSKREDEFYDYLRFRPKHIFNRMVFLSEQKDFPKRNFTLREWYSMFEPLNINDVINEF